MKRIPQFVPAVIALLLYAAPAAAQLTDTAYIFDCSRTQMLALKMGGEPLRLQFSNGDTLILDANSKNGRKTGDYIMGDHTIPSGKWLAEGVRIIFDKSKPCCIRATGSNLFRNKTFTLDTTLCLSSSTPRPLFFWNPLRQQYARDLSFDPVALTLSNKEFAEKKAGQTRRLRQFMAAVSHEYNTITGVLTPLRKP